jgi:peptidoglycan/xylan/chitin deacetylase (PgdA/CDA1 family)
MNPVLLRARKAFDRRRAKWLDRRPFALPQGRPMISFTFDDFPRSALFTGGAILEAAGAIGTFFTSFGLMGQTAPTGEIFRASDVPHLLSRGHELGCHTFEHCPAWETPPAAYEASLRRNAAALEQAAPGRCFQTHSFPISFPGPATKRIVGKTFRACRCGGQSFVRGTVDLAYLPAFFLEQSRDDFNAIERIITANASAGGWLIFATHDVSPSPTRFGCTPEVFEKTVRHSVASGARILSVAQALDAIGVPRLSRATSTALQPVP